MIGKTGRGIDRNAVESAFAECRAEFVDEPHSKFLFIICD